VFTSRPLRSAAPASRRVAVRRPGVVPPAPRVSPLAAAALATHAVGELRKLTALKERGAIRIVEFDRERERLLRPNRAHRPRRPNAS
jgi:hypothetical protein